MLTFHFFRLILYHALFYCLQRHKGSVPVYLAFIAWSGGGPAGLFGGWSVTAWVVSLLGAAGGLLVALSIKYGDAILKTLATTAAIILSSVLDWAFLDGPLTPIMVIAAVQVIVAICNYTFDPTPEILSVAAVDGAILSKDMTKDSDRPIRRGDEEIAMAERRKSESS
jgi:drug/metabolite transporter (DMT)-like permease